MPVGWSFLPGSHQAQAFTFAELPVQEGGRIKPFQTFAEETLQRIYGKSHYEGQNAMRILSTWMLVPELWVERDLVVIDHHGLKETLGFEKTQKRFSMKTLMDHQRLNTLFADVASRLSREEKLDPYYQAIQRLEIQMMTFLSVQRGALRVFPREDAENTAWLAVAELDEQRRESFFQILAAYAKTFTGSSEETRKLAQADLDRALSEFTQAAQAAGGERYPEQKAMSMEVHYQKTKPFLWTWVLYLLGALFVSLSYLFAEKFFFGDGTSCHGGGLFTS